jgi:hypothetical protein
MDTSSQPQPLSPQALVVGVITLTVFMCALWGNPEQSERAFRLLNLMHGNRD